MEKKKLVKRILFFLILFLLTILWSYYFFPMRSHWPKVFRPAALLLLQGESPYSTGYFFNPPWALIPFLPLSMIPERLGFAVYSAFTIFCFGFVGYKLGAKPIILALFVFLPQIFYMASQINVDCLVALGFIFPPNIGLVFVLLKPQLGAPIALFWLIEAWRKGKAKEVFLTFAPVTILFLLSFLIYGFWPLQFEIVLNSDINYSIFPSLLPVGLYLFFKSIKELDKKYAIASGPFLAPYTAFYSNPIAMLGFLSSTYHSIPILIGFYISGLSDKWLMNIIVDMFTLNY